jgi:hypothetical protein
MPNEKDRIGKLKKQIKQLKESLDYIQTENFINQILLKIACGRIGPDVEDFRKEVDTMLSAMQNKRRQQR